MYYFYNHFPVIQSRYLSLLLYQSTQLSFTSVTMQTDGLWFSGHLPINVVLKNVIPNLRTEGPCCVMAEIRYIHIIWKCNYDKGGERSKCQIKGITKNSLRFLHNDRFRKRPVNLELGVRKGITEGAVMLHHEWETERGRDASHGH